MRTPLALAISLLMLHVGLAARKPAVGPEKGSLLIVGGGALGPEIVERFLRLAGGKDAPIVFIPTAGDADTYPVDWLSKQFLAKAGARNVTLLHTRDRKVADTKTFVEPIRRARAVWFGGGRQWRLVDSYLNTRTHRELLKLLDRGGVIGGSSAGATIQGSYLVRGAREGNQLMMAPGYEVGLGLMRNVAIDQHLLKRNRQDDMVPVIEKHPQLLGIGIDESTAIVVQRDEFEVIGVSKVAIYDRRRPPEANGKRYYFLERGDRFDLSTRARLTNATSSSSRD
ncbi:MAG: cyanophycinase [Bryobacterales bacterium]|nr:cyanophycinase [Bryobacterales bacterium]